MDSHYLVTLITPMYNVDKTFGRTFESVRKQSIGFNNIEYILVDDQSTDDTYAMCQQLAKENENVKVYQLEKNSGGSGAPRNLGLSKATSEYIMFLDDDDYMYPEAVKSLYDAMRNNDCDIASGKWRARSIDNSNFKHEERDFVDNISPGIYDIRTAEFNVGHFFFNDFWTKIYKRSIIREYNVEFCAGHILEDLAYLYQYLVHCKNGCIVDTPVIDYLVRDTSLGHNRGVPFFTQMPGSLDFALERTKQCSKDDLFLEYLGKYCLMEYMVEMLMEARSFGEEEMSQVLSSWQTWFEIARIHNFDFHSTYAKILKNAANTRSVDSQVPDFLALKDLYWQRKDELNNIFNSRTWKFASFLQKLKR